MTEADAHDDAMTDVVLLRTQADRYRHRLDEWTDPVSRWKEGGVVPTEAMPPDPAGDRIQQS